MRNLSGLVWLVGLSMMAGGLAACRRTEDTNSAPSKEMAPNSVTSPPPEAPEDEKPTHPEELE